MIQGSIPKGGYDSSLLQSVQTSSEAHAASFQWVAETPSPVKYSNQGVPRLRIGGDIPYSLYRPSQHGQGQCYLYTPPLEILLVATQMD